MKKYSTPLFLSGLAILQCYLLGNHSIIRLVFLVLFFVGVSFRNGLTPAWSSVFSILFILLYYDSVQKELVFSDALNRDAPFFIVFLILLSIVGLVASLSFVAKWESVLIQPLTILISFYVVAPWVLRMLSVPFLIKTWFFLSYFIWYFVFLVRDRSVLPGKLLQRIGFLVPFSQLIATGGAQAPLLLGPLTYFAYKRKGGASESSPSLIKFLSLNAVLLLVGTQISRFNPLLQEGAFSAGFFSGIISFKQYLIWGGASFIASYFKIIGTMNLCVGFYRIGGIQYPAAMRLQVVKSKDFIDFFSNFLFYIKEIYFQLFFLPVFLGLRKISFLPLRMMLSTATAVFVGGILFHASLPVVGREAFIEKGFFSLLVTVPALWINPLLISLALMHSQWRRLNFKPSSSQHSIPQPIRFSLFLLFFLVTFFIESWPPGLTLSQLIFRYQSLIPR